MKYPVDVIVDMGSFMDDKVLANAFIREFVLVSDKVKALVVHRGQDIQVASRSRMVCDPRYRDALRGNPRHSGS